ncbi:hypothetical protein AAC387_Pa05g3002 [Persea americana]
MEEYLPLFVEEADFYKGILLGNLLPGNLWKPLPHMLQSRLRNYIGGNLLYFLSAAFWSFYIHYWKRHLYFPPGMALNPLDGILQAAPHVMTHKAALFIVPNHFMTHLVLLFCDGVWRTNIHDCIHGKVWPIMGAGYHSIHHTTYRHNYGHYTIWMDWMFGTLCHPEVDSKKLA